MLAVKTYLSTRPVPFISKSEIEMYQLEDAAGVMRYSERMRSKKRLKASQLMCLKLHQLRQLSFKPYFRKISELLWFITEVQR